jgi:DNA-binding CsgD family transcriptional regulator
MAETDDAYTLLSDARHPMEILYADYANSMKNLANQARLEMVNTGKIAYSKTAKATYQAEVDELDRKLNDALLNTTRERAAQRSANAAIARKLGDNPDMSKSDIKKAGQQALTKSRTEVGSIARSKRSIKITDKEWEAIQAGAISENKLKQILNNTDIDDLRQRATPRAKTTINQAKISRIQSMRASNHTIAEIAAALNIPASTVSQYLKGVN